MGRLKRTPLKRKTGLQSRSRLKPVSAKKRAYRASKEGKDAAAHMRKVKVLPCCVCGAPGPSDVHHVIHDRYGTSRASDWDVIPLCKFHHQDSPEAIHSGKETWREKYGPDHSYLEWTRKQVKRIIA